MDLNIKPYDVYFSTSSISNHFTNGMFLDGIFDKIINGLIPLHGEMALPHIEVVLYDHEYWVVRGNRRLYVMRKLYVAGFLDTIAVDVLEMSDKVRVRFFSCFTTTCNGRYVKVRNTPLLPDMDELVRDVMVEWWKKRSRQYESLDSTTGFDYCCYNNVHSYCFARLKRKCWERDFGRATIFDTQNSFEHSRSTGKKRRLIEVTPESGIPYSDDCWSDEENPEMVEASETVTSSRKCELVRETVSHKSLTMLFRSYWSNADERRKLLKEGDSHSAPCRELFRVNESPCEERSDVAVSGSHEYGSHREHVYDYLIKIMNSDRGNLKEVKERDFLLVSGPRGDNGDDENEDSDLKSVNWHLNSKRDNEYTAGRMTENEGRVITGILHELTGNRSHSWHDHDKHAKTARSATLKTNGWIKMEERTMSCKKTQSSKHTNNEGHKQHFDYLWNLLEEVRSS